MSGGSPGGASGGVLIPIRESRSGVSAPQPGVGPVGRAYAGECSRIGEGNVRGDSACA